jgi:hypothetical protein
MHAQINFYSMVSQRHVPEELNTEDDLKEAKNTYLRHVYNEEVKKRGFFKSENPYDFPCPKCSGTGEFYKLIRVEVKQKPCKSCEGTGFLWRTCRKCKGSTRYIKQKSKNLIINVKCTKCAKYKDEWPEGKVGVEKIKCRDCRSKKQKVKFVGIESSTLCPVCKGYGFKRQHLKVVPNPVFPIGKLNEIIKITKPELQPKDSEILDIDGNEKDSAYECKAEKESMNIPENKT